MAVERALITPQEVAEMLSVSRSTVYALVQRGELPAVRSRRGFRVPAAAVQEWVRRRRAENVPLGPRVAP